MLTSRVWIPVSGNDTIFDEAGRWPMVLRTTLREEKAPLELEALRLQSWRYFKTVRNCAWRQYYSDAVLTIRNTSGDGKESDGSRGAVQRQARHRQVESKQLHRSRLDSISINRLRMFDLQTLLWIAL